MADNDVKFEWIQDNPMFSNVVDVSVQDVMRLKDKLQLIDVRQPDEFVGELGHIEGATLIVMDTIPDHLNKIAKDKTVVIVCRSGQRSARVSAFLAANGFDKIYNMAGGMIAWNQFGFPTSHKSE